LKDFVSTDDGVNLLTAYKRAANILAIEEKKDKKPYTGDAIDENLLKEEPEINLVKSLAAVSVKMKTLFDNRDFSGCMREMSALRKPVDAFFEKIHVNAPEPNVRINRLRLLARLRETINPIADFSKLEG